VSGDVELLPPEAEEEEAPKISVDDRIAFSQALAAIEKNGELIEESLLLTPGEMQGVSNQRAIPAIATEVLKSGMEWLRDEFLKKKDSQLKTVGDRMKAIELARRVHGSYLDMVKDRRNTGLGDREVVLRRIEERVEVYLKAGEDPKKLERYRRRLDQEMRECLNKNPDSPES
jgi:hypothetical protein